MPLPDKVEQFESYLKEFCPLAPEPLHPEVHRSPARRPFLRIAWAVACAAVLVLAFVLPHRFKRTGASRGGGSWVIVPQHADSQSLTLGRANAMLASSPSLKEAVDQLSFPHQPTPQAPGRQSALAALGKEDFKL